MTVRSVQLSGCMGHGELTLDDPASSYGRPVLVLDGQPYGPADHVPCGAGEETWYEPAATAVARAALLYPPMPLGPECHITDPLFGAAPVRANETASEAELAEWQADNRDRAALRDRFVARAAATES